MSNNNVLAGRYELIEKIGDGGMAIVYKAKCRVLKRFVAIKILKPEFTQDAKFVENFRRESHAAASLSHPNIVSIYDVGQEGNINYIVMELVTGMTLSEMIKAQAPLDYKKAISITKQIAAGLSAAHKKGIVHRDVKPHNILITEDGIAKIADFGIAKAVTNTTIVDSTKDNVMGSVHYFSPEQAKGGYVDEKSDIYSLGIVLFEMLTGKVPFDGENPVAIALMQINEKITPPSVYNHNIPPRLENIILKATEKQPSKRFATADEMIEALEDLETVNRVVGDSVYAAADNYDNHDYINDYDDEDEYEDEYEEKKKPKKKKTKNKSKKKKGSGGGKKVGIIAGVVVLIAAILGVTFATGLFDKKDIEVPDFKGMTIEEAEAKADDLGIKVEIGDYEFSSEYDQDEIMSQNPDEGEMVAKGDVVTVDISKGEDKGVVPNLIGKSESEAKEMIEQYGYKVGSVTEKESEKTKGTVLSQDPSAGSEVSSGSTINIVISDGKGKEKVEVPNLLGMSEAAAKKAIKNAGFKVGKVSEGVSSSYDEGEVMWQEYNSGTKLEKGETINIRISKGKSSTIELYIPFQDAENEVFQMTVTVNDDNGTRNQTYTCNKSDGGKGGKYIKVQGTGKGTIVVVFDGSQEIMRREVDFASGDVG